MPARKTSRKVLSCLVQQSTRPSQVGQIPCQPSTKRQGRPACPKLGDRMATFFEGARLSETAGGRASSPSRSTLTALDSGFINHDSSPQPPLSNVLHFPRNPNTCAHWWTYAALCQDLGQHHAGPLGPASGIWIPTGVQHSSTPWQTQTSSTSSSDGSTASTSGRNRCAAEEAGDSSPGTPSGSRVIQQHLRGAEKGRGMEADNKPEKPKQPHPLTSFQNGEYFQLERYNSSRRLDVQVGLEGCISVSPSPQNALVLPLVQLGERVLRVQNSPFWPHLGSVCVYQTPSSSSLAASTAGNQNSNLLGRLAVNGIRSRPPQGSDSTRNQSCIHCDSC